MIQADSATLTLMYTVEAVLSKTVFRARQKDKPSVVLVIEDLEMETELRMKLVKGTKVQISAECLSSLSSEGKAKDLNETQGVLIVTKLSQIKVIQDATSTSTDLLLQLLNDHLPLV